MKNANFKNTLSATIGSLVVSGLAASAIAQADSNPFAATELSSGYMVVAEGSCGEGKCGANAALKEKKSEGACGEGKCGGAHESKTSEGACGEGKCGAGKGERGGDEKSASKTSEGACGEGKCGGDSKAGNKTTEGSCGEGKCGHA